MNLWRCSFSLSGGRAHPENATLDRSPVFALPARAPVNRESSSSSFSSSQSGRCFGFDYEDENEDDASKRDRFSTLRQVKMKGAVHSVGGDDVEYRFQKHGVLAPIGGFIADQAMAHGPSDVAIR